MAINSAAEVTYETANGPYGFNITPAGDLSDEMLWQIADLAATELPYPVTATYVTRTNLAVVERPEES